MVTLGNDLDLCPGETMLLTPVFSDVNTWLWQDGSSAHTYTVSGAGIITVEVSNSCSTCLRYTRGQRAASCPATHTRCRYCTVQWSILCAVNHYARRQYSLA